MEPEEFVAGERAFAGQSISIKNETIVLDSLREALTAMLQQYPTTLEQDIKMIAKKDELPIKKQFALQLRLSEKKILLNNIAKLQRRRSAV